MQLAKHKITPPRPLEHFVRRERLLRSLTGNGSASVLIVAPAGYGKTALVSQFFEQLPRQMKCWLDLDTDDAKPWRFAQNLLVALAASVASLRSSGLVNGSAGAGIDLNLLAEELGLFFDQYRGAPVWLTLDNWERVNDDGEICRFVEKLVSIPDSRLRLIVNSRVKPRFRYRRIVESGRLELIDKDSLSFTRDELTLAIKQRTGTLPDSDTVEEFLKLTNGWCVLAGLMIKRFSDAELLSSITALTQVAELQEYLLQELFADCSKELYDFLVRCSPLDTLSPASCQVVEPCPEKIEAFLNEIRSSGIPYSALDMETLRLHPLIVHSLRGTLRGSYGAEIRVQVYNKIVEHYLAAGDPEIAIELLLEIESFSECLRLIRTHWNALAFKNELPSVDRWLGRIPESFHHHPDFVFSYVECQHWLGNHQKVIEKIGPLLESGLLEHDKDLLGVLWHRYYKTLKVLERRTLYDNYISLWEKFRRTHGPFSSHIVAGVEDMLSFVAFNECRFNEAAEHTRRALELISNTDPHGAAWFTAQYQFNIHLLGRSAEAIATLSQHIEAVRAQQQGKYPSPLASFLAVILAEVGRYREALEVVRKGREGLSQIGLFEQHMLLIFERCEGICLIHEGKTERGLAFLEQALARSRTRLPHFYQSSAILYNYYCELADQSSDLSALPVWQDQPVVSQDYVYGAFVRVYYYLKGGDFAAAEKWLQQLKDVVTKYDLKPSIMMVSFWEALLQFKRGRQDLAQSSLEKGATILNRIGWRSFPLINTELAAFIVGAAVAWEIELHRSEDLANISSRRDLKEVIVSLLQREPTTEKQKQLLLVWGLKHQIGGLAGTAREFSRSDRAPLQRAAETYLEHEPEFPLPPLAITTFGGLSVSVDGSRVDFARKKSRLLFAVLLAKHPLPLHEEALLDILLSGKRVRRPLANIRTIASSLRHSLQGSTKSSTHYIEYGDGMYRLQLPDSSAVDFMEIASTYNRVSAAGVRPHKMTEEELRPIRDVLDLYTRDFLPEYRFEEFAATVRERVRAQYLELLALTVESLMHNRNYVAAERYVLAGLSHEPIWSDGIELAIRLFQKSGQTIKGIRVYQKYVKDLKEELQVEPSKMLQEQFSSILA